MKLNIRKIGDKFVATNDIKIGGDNCWTTKGLFKKFSGRGAIFSSFPWEEYSETYYDLNGIESIVATDFTFELNGVPKFDLPFKLINSDDTQKINWKLDDIINAVKYGFEYHRDSMNDGENVPLGNTLQWLEHYKMLKLKSIIVEEEADYSNVPEDENDIILPWRCYVDMKVKIIDGKLIVKNYIFD
jgi:hypothetical protein